ncbi:MAG: carbohydrate binding family 9 domain-containing protein [Acidobacteriota bacterium]|nr:carbohydrate binding family 9 domain-containing protein [Acidobacteriota bacterium]
MKRFALGALGGVLVLLAAQHTFAAEPVTIARADSSITVDGVLSDPAWQHATKYETWYETNPGDNIPPRVKTTGYVTYDSRFLYIGIEAEDPNPKEIIAPYADHDQISGNTDDYAGVILDTRNDGKTGYLFLMTARGVQYDAVTDDAGSGEDNSPDFFWDSAAKVHERGWTAEARIPFSSLRYEGSNPERWGLILYRNYPRDRRYQIFTEKLPRNSNCFVCNYGKITGLHDLPAGDHMVVAPYVTAQQLGEPLSDLGSRFVNHQVGADGGLDLKWNPTADMAVDATINPDFSQVESDVAVISTNERFAIFIPEKRPFFLEGIELFSTPIQAVYTRTLTAPRWGGRTTGKRGHYAYTFLVAQDRGGGSVILPSAFGSDLASQDFSSIAAIGRVRRDFAHRSFVSFLGTTRESEGGAHNRVFGPDFQWRIGESNTLTGQFLYSQTRTPERPDLADEWNGQKLSGHGINGVFQHATAKHDFYINYNDFAKGFRADNGFVPQTGWRGSYTEAGRTFRPKGFFSRVRTFAMAEYQQTQDGDLLYRLVSAGFGADGRHRSFLRLRLAHDTVSNGGTLFDRNRLYYSVNFAVSRVVSFVSFDGWLGEEVDFANDRLGRGANVNASATLRPTNHLQIGLTTGLRWLNIDGDRLFTAQVERVRTTYTFNARTFIRAIVQNQRTNRDLALYGPGFDQHSGQLSSQLLFAYKLNWQTVFYVGGGNLDEMRADDGDLLTRNRQFFAKLSYAFQR